jgi:hypothetical protein
MGSKFQLLEAESMVWRGMYDDALRLLAALPPDSDNPEETIREAGDRGVIFTHQQQLSEADQRLLQAEGLCESHRLRGLRRCAQGARNPGRQTGQFAQAPVFLDTLAFARNPS